MLAVPNAQALGQARHLAEADGEQGQDGIELQAPSRAGRDARLEVEERVSALGLAFRSADPLR